MKLLMLIMLITSTSLTQMNHPLSFGLIILLYSFMIMSFSALLLSSFWFSYILLLIYLGGLLILFIYISSLVPNEKMWMWKNKTLFMVMSLLMTFTMLTTLNFWNNYMLINPYQLSILKFYSSSSYILTISLIMYLLIALFIVVSLTSIEKGPLRLLT